MFSAATKMASSFTRPIITSRRYSDGQLGSSIGAYVVVNDSGWIVTAGHVLKELVDLASAKKAAPDGPDSAAKATRQERRRRTRTGLGNEPPRLTNFSPWLGADAIGLTDVYVLVVADLGFARLDPFDSGWIDHYPVFKDPAQDVNPGTSLCKLGYPFHAVEPEFNEEKDSFILPAGSVPPPLFPMEGIYTRTVMVDVEGPPPPYPIMYLETSSPGLRGQSGGPTYDQHGTVWAIQSQTAHLPLGFEPKIKSGSREYTEHQFLNVGWGVHPETLIAAMTELGIEHNLSPY